MEIKRHTIASSHNIPKHKRPKWMKSAIRMGQRLLPVFENEDQSFAPVILWVDTEDNLHAYSDDLVHQQAVIMIHTLALDSRATAVGLMVVSKRSGTTDDEYANNPMPCIMIMVDTPNGEWLSRGIPPREGPWNDDNWHVGFIDKDSDSLKDTTFNRGPFFDIYRRIERNRRNEDQM